MKDILSIEFIENDRRGHEDIMLEICELGIKEKLDSYYFILAIEPIYSKYEIKIAVSFLIVFWLNKLKALRYGESIYLPIDFSDQYVGCLKLSKEHNIKILYGYSLRAGYNICPLNPNDFYKNVEDFEVTCDTSVTVDEGELRECLEDIIKKLKMP